MKYQLLKTSPLLSGQVRWDLVVNKKTATDLHIVPINDNIVFNEDNDRKTLNYDHRENLKYLYRTLQSDFWSTIGVYDSLYPLYNQGYILDPFDHTYEMGLRRMRYKRYNKQFSFLCPMWVSENLDFSELRFRVSVSDADPISINSKRRINVMTNISLSERIVSYLNEFMSHSDDGNPVDDNLVSFKFDPVGAYITGVNVESGKYQTIQTPEVLKNILERERPMMEFDSMILDSFRTHNVIAQQLINFNIVFNLDDIVSKMVSNSLLYHDINVTVDILYDDKVIQKKDLYTNYTNIPAYSVEFDDYTHDKNVLEYLGDHRCKDLVYVNKTTQPIFHWSLLENPEFIYNLYDGFAPIFNEDGETYRVNGLYYNQSNLSQKESSVLESTLEWCKHYVLVVQNRSIDVSELAADKENSTPIPVKQDIIWFSNNKFDMSDVDIQGVSKDLRVMTVRVLNLGQVPSDNTIKLYSKLKKFLYVYTYKSEEQTVLVFLSNTDDLLTMGSVSDMIGINSNLNKDLLYIKQLYDHWKKPYKIEIFKSIKPKSVTIDNNIQDVIDYGKDDHSYSYVYRYTGKIIPCFINVDDPMRYSVEFFYKQWSRPSDISDFNDRIKAGYVPEYPKIIKQKVNIQDKIEMVDMIDDKSFYSLCERKFGSKQTKWYKDNNYQGDITWLNDNRVWIFPSEIDLECVIENYKIYTEDQITEILWKQLYNQVKNNNTSIVEVYKKNEEWFEQYLKKIYKFDFDFDYADDNINNIKYNIKYSLI